MDAHIQRMIITARLQSLSILLCRLLLELSNTLSMLEDIIFTKNHAYFWTMSRLSMMDLLLRPGT